MNLTVIELFKEIKETAIKKGRMQERYKFGNKDQNLEEEYRQVSLKLCDLEGEYCRRFVPNFEEDLAKLFEK